MAPSLSRDVFVPVAVGITAGISAWLPSKDNPQANLVATVALPVAIGVVAGILMLFLIRVGVFLWEFAVDPYKQKISALESRPESAERPRPIISPEHVKEITESARWTQLYIRDFRPSFFTNVRQPQHEPVMRRSFFSHFPETHASIEQWDAYLAERTNLRDAVDARVSKNAKELSATLGIILGGNAISTLQGNVWQRMTNQFPTYTWYISAGGLYFGGNLFAALEQRDEIEIDSLKDSYNKFLHDAEQWEEVAMFQQNTLRQAQFVESLVPRLAEIERMHALPNSCQLCLP